MLWVGGAVVVLLVWSASLLALRDSLSGPTRVGVFGVICPRRQCGADPDPLGLIEACPPGA
jgi:hypothetical protein